MKMSLISHVVIMTLVCALLLSSCSVKQADTPEGAVTLVTDGVTSIETENEDTTKPEDNGTDNKETNKTEQNIPQKSEEKESEVKDGKESGTVDNSVDKECKHSFGEWKTVKAATCIQDGESERVCSKCGFAEIKTVAKTGKHTEVEHPAVPATCAEEGMTRGSHCSECNVILVPQHKLSKKPHVFKDDYRCDCGEYVESAKFVIMSQNVRSKDDGENKNISDRAPRFKQLVEKYNPDIIGTQEVTATWYKYFQKNLSATYGLVGCSREGKDATSGEWNAILYRRERFELIESGDFWLSSTPDKVSRVSGSKCNRICTWALLKDKNTGKTFVMANTHLDHSTDEIRKQQLDCLFKELSNYIDSYPLFLTGDFNALPDSSVYTAAVSRLIDTRYGTAENRSVINYTFDSYGEQFPGKTIDYCFYNDKADAHWYQIADDQFGGYVSDHYALVAQFGIK